MVGLDCKQFPMTKVGTHIGGRLADDGINIIVLAMNDIEKVEVDNHAKHRANREYFHKLPSLYPSTDFGICVEADDSDHRHIDLYEETMNVYYVKSIPEVAVVSNKAIYFESGRFQLNDLHQDTTNYCTHESSVMKCLEMLFEPPE
ncbi:hypothetical protein ACAH01_08815 [Halomicrobium sp. HM KBTZ05]|uniref:hypothetical protein n=1 Tax=Halomicrobium sp. HM KBTZ05 TaxID=3242663 RepID=UPI0035561FB4